MMSFGARAFCMMSTGVFGTLALFQFVDAFSTIPPPFFAFRQTNVPRLKRGINILADGYSFVHALAGVLRET